MMSTAPATTKDTPLSWCPSPSAAIGLVTLVVATFWLSDAHAAAGLTEVADRIRELNGDMRLLGGVLACAGFMWALLCVSVGVAGAGAAISMLGVGLAISFAPQIVEAITGISGV